MLGLQRLETHIGFRHIFLGVLLIIFLFLRGSYAYEQGISATDSAVNKKLSQRHDRVDIAYYEIDRQKVRYADIGAEEAPLLILVHGAPGGISTRYKLLQTTKLLDTYRIIILDRPGYGKSGSKAVTSLAEQARFTAPLLDLNQHPTKPIVIGHSLGPAVVAKMAIMYPEKIGGMIFVAGAVSPEHERVWWISYPLDIPILRLLVAPPLRVTNKEKLTHVAELELLQKELAQITHPLIVMHGDADWIVPVGNAYFIQQHASNAQLDMRIQPERNHFLPFDRAGTIEQAVEDMYGKLGNST